MITDLTNVSRLIVRVAARDTAAFAALHSATNRKLFKSAVCILRNREDADDAVQETYLKVWTRAASYRPSECSPISWLVAIVRNQAVDHLRRRRVPQSEISAGEMVIDTGSNPEQMAIWHSMAALVRRHIEALRIERREAVFGVFLEGLSYGEVAERHKVPLGTVKNRIHCGINDLRHRLALASAEN